MASDSAVRDAAKRANDFGDSYLNVPGYANDTMFFILRYVHKAELQMCRADYQSFMATVEEYSNANKELQQDRASNLGENSSVVERTQKLKSLREAALEKLKDYPELERDFDRFVSASRALSAATKRAK